MRVVAAAIVARARPRRDGLGRPLLSTRRVPDPAPSRQRRLPRARARADPGLTAWAVLGLAAAGHCSAQIGGAVPRRQAPADRHGLSSSGSSPWTRCATCRRAGAATPSTSSQLVSRLQGLRRDNGRIGPTVNSTIWGILALRATGREAGARRRSAGCKRRSARAAAGPGTPAARPTRTTPRPRSRRSSRPASTRGAPRSTAASPSCAGSRTPTAASSSTRAAARTRSRPPGRSRRSSPPTARSARAAFRYLRRMQRENGSFRYNRQYVTTPVWVTSQALAALAREPFPLAPVLE